MVVNEMLCRVCTLDASLNEIDGEYRIEIVYGRFRDEDEECCCSEYSLWNVGKW
jgi:hypothetical protein